MTPTRIPIRFEPAEHTAWVEPGTTVHEAALVAGVPLSAPCGGRGVCGSCGVRVVAGALDTPDEVEAGRLGDRRAGIRLGCRAKVIEPVTVRPIVMLSTGQAVAPAFEPTARLAVAVDFGTTSVSAVAIDVDSGMQGAIVTLPNAQAAAGSDVLSRLAAAMDGGVEPLRLAAERTLRQAIERAVGRANVTPETVVVAGNTAMSALLAGADVSSLAAHPFAAPALPRTVEVGLDCGRVGARLLPSIAGFVGGDTVACLVHTGMSEAGETALLVDLGTNAEIALVSDGRLWVSSAAAGPAFEGVGIECGRPAGPGAVVKAEWMGEHAGVRLQTLGGDAPGGLAGSGLISVVALLRKLEHIGPDGLLSERGPLSDAFYRGADGVLRVVLGSDDAVTLSQLDVRQLQLAKAAVAVGVSQVLAAAGIGASSLDHVYVAGAFGSALSDDDVVELGVVPRSAAGVIHGVGNASLYGALAVALDARAAETTIELAHQATHIELAALPGFQAALINALALEPYDA